MNVAFSPISAASPARSSTADFQNATVAFSVTYQLNPSQVKNVWVAARQDWADRFLPPAVNSAIKQVVGQTTATQLIQNRATTEAAIKVRINAALNKRGIIVSDFAMRDVSFSKDFEAAVERKQVAIENAQAAKNGTVEVQEKANQRVIAAEADAKAMAIKSAALATSPGLAEYEAVQRWDGVLPTQMLGEAVPFINVK